MQLSAHFQNRIEALFQAIASTAISFRLLSPRPTRSTSMLIIPKRASDFFTATSLWGRARVNEGTGSGGGIKHRERNENLVITITRKQRRAVWNTRNANFIITVCK
jgi:hypothetical protein